MVRQLKHHEQRLLKKVDFAHYKQESVRENTVMVKYQLEKRGEYLAYNSIAGQIRKLATKLSLLDPKDPYGQEKTDAMLEKLFKMGLITAKNIAQCEKITVSAFCR